MRKLVVALILVATLAACSPPSGELGRCRASPEVEGKRVADEAFAAFIRETQQQPSGTSMHEVTAGIDPENIEYLGMPPGEPDDLLEYEFRAAGTQSPTFHVLVSDDCRTEVHWN